MVEEEEVGSSLCGVSAATGAASMDWRRYRESANRSAFAGSD